MAPRVSELGVDGRTIVTAVTTCPISGEQSQGARGGVHANYDEVFWNRNIDIPRSIDRNTCDLGTEGGSVGLNILQKSSSRNSLNCVILTEACGRKREGKKHGTNDF